MKNVLLFVLVLFSAKFIAQEKTTVIKGKVYGNTPVKIGYTLPIKNTCNWGFKNFIKSDSLGNFEIKVGINQPSLVRVFVPKKAGGSLFLIPGKEYFISFSSSGFTINKGEEGQEIYNKNLLSGNIYYGSQKFNSNLPVEKIQQKISIQKITELKLFRKAFKESKISKELYLFIKNERETYYASILARIILGKFQKTVGNEIVKPLPKKTMNLWDNIFKNSSPNSIELLSSPYWFDYAKLYLEKKQFTSKNFSLKKLKKTFDSGLLNTAHLNIAEKHLTGVPLESYYATYILEKARQKKFEKELISLFNKFKEKFPKSPFNKHLKPLVDPIISFHKKAKVKNSKIRFLTNYNNLNSLESVVSSFNKKMVYIDVWATWCGPCKEEFKHKKALQKILSANNVEILYISIDNPKRDKRWKEMINFYNLEGTHIRANKKLLSDLIKIFDRKGSIVIPWYILVDKNGAILKKDAKKPSEIKQLENQLKTLKV